MKRLPYAYLRYLFTELPKAKTTEKSEALLPSSSKLKNLLIKYVL
ncbi:MAG: transposase domain-containing protein [Thiohalomonadales bacterium]